MLFGRVSRKILLTHPKTNSSIFSYQTWLKLQIGLASMVGWNLKMSFLAAQTQDGFGEHRDKKYPCVQWNILLYFDVVGLYFCWRSWTSCLDTWHHGFYQIPTDKKIIRNLIMGHVWIFQPDNNPNTNLKKKYKEIGHWAQNQASAMAIPVLWPGPCREWVEWTEEKHQSWSGESKGSGVDSGWRNGLWSLVRCYLTSSGIIGENVELLNWQMEVSKRIEQNVTVNCGQCVLEKKKYFIIIFPPILNSYYPIRFLWIFLIKDQND